MSIYYRKAMLGLSSEKNKLKQFLNNNGLELEEDIDHCLLAIDDERIIATASLSQNIIKCVAVSEEYKGQGISNALISQLLLLANEKGINHIFVFTKSDNVKIFQDLGFSKVEEADNYVLMDNKISLLYNYLNELERHKVKGGNIASIVMNCNPFTLGHKYLIEKALAENDWLHVFLLEEDKSIFPFADRCAIVQEEISKLSRVSLHKSGEYIISLATFPTYFLKDKQIIIDTHAKLDAKIFGEYIAKALNINKRYVGTENLDPVTNNYNKCLKHIMPQYSISLVEIPRLIVNNQPISASSLRKYLSNPENDIYALKDSLPKASFEYLISPRAKPIIEKLRLIHYE